LTLNLRTTKFCLCLVALVLKLCLRLEAVVHFLPRVVGQESVHGQTGDAGFARSGGCRRAGLRRFDLHAMLTRSRSRSLFGLAVLKLFRVVDEGCVREGRVLSNSLVLRLDHLLLSASLVLCCLLLLLLIGDGSGRDGKCDRDCHDNY